MDKDGWLYVTGRSREVINRGGELISPTEVENAVISHPLVKSCVAFPIEDEQLGEIVAVGLILDDKDACTLTLKALRAHCMKSGLNTAHLPQSLAILTGKQWESLPQTATGKLQRNKLSCDPTMEAMLKVCSGYSLFSLAILDFALFKAFLHQCFRL